MKNRSKMGILSYIVVAVVVVILLCGIFSIIRRLSATSSTEKLSDGSQIEITEESTQEEADNSVPITKLTVSAPEPSIRVGDTMQLEISYKPKNATNPKLIWSCSEDGYVTISEDGVLTPSEDSAKSTVTVTAETTDGSGLSCSFQLRIFPEIDPDKPMVAITFDDGPYPETTNAMLDALEENYAKATFFCLGQNVEYYPETVQREYELGMEVATHTYGHIQLTTLSGENLEDEIKKAVNANEDLLGFKPTLMRPPYGSYNSEVLSMVEAYNLCLVNWSLDTEDWKTKNADATYAMVMTAVDGDVVLLHDIHEYNVNAVERFVPDLIAEGFQLVTVSEMYEARGETLDPGTVHFRTDPTTEDSGETTAAEDGDGNDVSDGDGADDITASGDE